MKRRQYRAADDWFWKVMYDLSLSDEERERRLKEGFARERAEIHERLSRLPPEPPPGLWMRLNQHWFLKMGWREAPVEGEPSTSWAGRMIERLFGLQDAPKPPVSPDAKDNDVQDFVRRRKRR